MASKVSVAPAVQQALNNQAQTALTTAVDRYCTDLLSEASRLEAALNTSGNAPEVTSSMIQDADLLLRRGYAKRRKGALLLGAQLVSAVGGFVTGLLADGDVLKDPGNLAIFVVFLATTIVATVIAVMRDQ